MEGLYGPGWMDAVCPPDVCGGFSWACCTNQSVQSVSIISEAAICNVRQQWSKTKQPLCCEKEKIKASPIRGTVASLDPERRARSARGRHRFTDGDGSLEKSK